MSKDKPIKLLFVCAGNTCRSPMAAAIAQAMLKEKFGDVFECDSAGSAIDEGPIAENVNRALLKDGFRPAKHNNARQVTREMLEEADIVVYLGHTAIADLVRDFPQFKTKMVPYFDDMIPDPFDLQGFSKSLIRSEDLTKGCLRAYELVAEKMRDEYTPALMTRLEKIFSLSESKTLDEVRIESQESCAIHKIWC